MVLENNPLIIIELKKLTINYLFAIETVGLKLGKRKMILGRCLCKRFFNKNQLNLLKQIKAKFITTIFYVTYLLLFY